MRAFLSTLVAGALLVSLVLGAVAQEVLRFHGRVVWIAGETMVLAPDEGGSVNVDLTQVDQSAYNTLQAGSGVTVIGVVSEDRTKLIAQSVVPD